MPAINVTRISPQEFTAYEVTPENTIDIMGWLSRAIKSGKWFCDPKSDIIDGQVRWWPVLRPNQPGAQELYALPDYVIVASDDFESVCVLDGPTARATYHDDVPLKWDSSAPVVTVGDGGTEVVVPQPTSFNGPWTFSVTVDGQLAELVAEPQTALTRSEDAQRAGAILGATTTLSLAALPPGEYEVVVTVSCDEYEHAATSQPATVTVPEPEPEPEPEPQ